MVLQATTPRFNKLITQWLTYVPEPHQPGRVDIIVNSQLWSAMNYLERYEFTNRVGLASEALNYDTWIFSSTGDLLTSYICNRFVSESSSQAPQHCQIEFHGAPLLFDRDNPLEVNRGDRFSE
jgi:hypothetical protein